MAVQDVSSERPWHRHYEPGVPTRLEYPEVPLHDFLAQSARLYPDRHALIFQRSALTYRQVDQLANRFATALVDLG